MTAARPPAQPPAQPPALARQPESPLPRDSSTRTHEPDASVAGEEDPGSADEELRTPHTPGRDSA